MNNHSKTIVGWFSPSPVCPFASRETVNISHVIMVYIYLQICHIINLNFLEANI